jgi:diaminopropionate ammonia-lyase
MDFFLSRSSGIATHGGLFSSGDYADVEAFFSSRSDLVPTPVRALDGLAAATGLGSILVKDESLRFGLPAFKILGVTYAVDRLIREGGALSGTLVCATAGNHGRAVARVARLRHLRARVYVPAATVPARCDAIAGEGAVVVRIDGPYEAAVEQAAEDALREGWTVVSDTSWPGYETIPRWIMAGYTRLLTEASGQWGPSPPDVVVVQAGVGGLAGAVANWCADTLDPHPYVIVAEPASAACALASARAGRPVRLEGALETAMAGLRCGEVSPVVWPSLASTVQAFVAVEDGRAEDAMRLLARPLGNDPPVAAGASGACGLAALLAVAHEARLRPVREAVRLGTQSRTFVIITEGVTDPDHYARVLGGRTGLP